MINALIGIKKNMTSAYDYRGRRVGATVLEVAPNFVSQIKTSETKDGYNAVQLGAGTKKSVRKPQLGHFKKAGIEQPLRWVRELRTQDNSDLTLGQELKLSDVFKTGDLVKVTGTSKGKGFQGVVRRHGFHGGPKTHGQSDRHRAPGSIGSGTTPGRVYKGKKMGGHMGSETVSYKNLEVISIDKDNNLIAVKGGIPGPVGGVVFLQNIGQLKGYVVPVEEVVEEAEAPQEQTEDVEALSQAEATEATAPAEEAAATELEAAPEAPAQEPIEVEESQAVEEKEEETK